MIEYANVRVTINELHTQETEYPVWEVPILRAVHGDAVEILSKRYVDVPTPGPEDEFRRLENRYRSAVNEDGSKGLPYVASVYGQYGIGTQMLKRAIMDATKDAPPADLIGGDKVSSVGG